MVVVDAGVVDGDALALVVAGAADRDELHAASETSATSAASALETTRRGQRTEPG